MFTCMETETYKPQIAASIFHYHSIIKTCLALWHRSKQAYEILRDSGFIKLPSTRLLQYHRGKIKPVGWTQF